MNNSRIIVAGIGPGSPEDITPAVVQAVKAAMSLSAISIISNMSGLTCRKVRNVSIQV